MKIKDIIERFYKIYGEDKNNDIRIFTSPGRVNLIGEHIDYNGGSVFPAALTLASTVVVRKRDDNLFRVYACDLNYVVQSKLDCLEKYKECDWGNYQFGVADELIKAGYDIKGCDMVFDDQVPLGSGLSSSAAIEVVTALALMKISGYEADMVEMAKISQLAEHNYVGVNCGIMDQFASAMGKKDNAIYLDCNTLDYKYIPLDLGDYKIVLGNTKKKRSLGESKYNERRSECEVALKDLQNVFNNAEYLCDLTSEDFDKNKELIKDEVCRRRAKHAIYENKRVSDSIIALENNDLILFGKLMNQSHESLRYDYEVSCKELDTIVDSARKQRGVLGSRMTGAGFGGCTVSLVKDDCVEDFITNVGKTYKEIIGHEADFYISEIGDGGREIV